MRKCILIFALAAFSGSAAFGQNGRYAVDALVKSPDCTVYADGVECFTELFCVPTPSGPAMTPREVNFVYRVGEYIGDEQRLALARFNPLGESSAVEIRLADYSASCRISPSDAVSELSGVGSKNISFRMASGSYAYVEIDSLPPLLISSEKAMSVPKKSRNLRYFGPGVHEAGLIELKSGETLFIDAGAVVYGTVKMNGCSDVTIAGNGILDTSHEERGAAIHFDKCRNISINGLTVRSAKAGWMIVPTNSSDIEIRDLKILGFGANNDGIDLVSDTDVHISGCFIRSTDDCITLKTGKSRASARTFISDCKFYGFASSDGVIVGYEARSAIDSVFVRNCDVLACRGTSTTGGKSPFSIICDRPGPITNIFFEDCTVSDNVEYKNLEISVTDGKQYVNMEPGNVNNVVFRNVHWGKGEVPLMIWGHDAEHRVTNVTFENCSMGREPLRSHKDANILVNRYTDMIKFNYSGKERTFRRF